MPKYSPGKSLMSYFGSTSASPRTQPIQESKPVSQQNKEDTQEPTTNIKESTVPAAPSFDAEEGTVKYL